MSFYDFKTQKFNEKVDKIKKVNYLSNKGKKIIDNTKNNTLFYEQSKVSTLNYSGYDCVD